MDGLFELTIIALILLAPVFEGWARSRKKKRQEEGREDGGAGDRSRGEEPGTTSTPWTTSTPGRAGGPGRWGEERPGAGGVAGRGDEPRRPGEPERERGADELLPDDLWEILTGQKRGPTTGPVPPAEPTPRAERPSGSEAPSREEPVAAERWEPESTGSRPGGADLGGMMSEPSPWDGERDEAARSAPSAPSVPPDSRRPGSDAAEPRTADVLAELEAELVGARSAAGRGSLGVRRDRISGLRGLRPGRAGKGGLSGMGEGGELHPFFKGLDRDGLRRAVVLNEVLGPPLSQRG